MRSDLGRDLLQQFEFLELKVRIPSFDSGELGRCVTLRGFGQLQLMNKTFFFPKT